LLYPQNLTSDSWFDTNKTKKTTTDSVTVRNIIIPYFLFLNDYVTVVYLKKSAGFTWSPYLSMRVYVVPRSLKMCGWIITKISEKLR